MDLVASSSTKFRYFVEGFDQDWIDTGQNHSATYTNLPPGKYTFRVQGMNSAGIWDNQGAEIAFSVLPPFWKTTWAFAIYALLCVLLGWMLHRVYYSYLVDRRATAVALQLFETEERADDEMQEQIEYQDQLIELAYRHKLDTLTLVRSFLPVPAGSPTAEGDPDYVSSSHRRVRVLSILEEHISYGPNGPAANLYNFVDALIPELIHKADVPTGSIITVNQLPQKLITCRLASPLAIIIYELVANSLEHAYHVDSLANYLFVELELSSDNEDSQLRYQLTISDNGIGCPGNLFDISEPGSGIGVVLSIVRAFDGEISMKVDEGTRISLSFPAGD
ncbi:MAG: triple tyrosine motif-containing protein [Halioglobus sp.]